MFHLLNITRTVVILGKQSLLTFILHVLIIRVNIEMAHISNKKPEV